MDKVDHVIYKVCGIKQVDMTGKQYVLSLIISNALWFLSDTIC
ncbi:Potassium-transporting ATPase potassium-binding subunit OS=Lysinibacillus sphaericus OX=1421 GN=kdpA PE=3 SV=1 [Lysinibacillus sphaericus]